MRELVLVLAAALGLSGAALAQVSAPASGKPIKTSREYIRSDVPQTWEDLIEASDIIAIVNVVSGSSGEVDYYGRHKSAVTAQAVTLQQVLVSRTTHPLPEDGRLLILVPGGTIDRGEYLERIVLDGWDPWQPGETFLVALKWDERLTAWRPTAYYESTFQIRSDGSLHTQGSGPIARSAKAAGQAETLRMLSRMAAPYAGPEQEDRNTEQSEGQQRGGPFSISPSR